MYRYAINALLLLALGVTTPAAFGQAKSQAAAAKSPALDELDCRTFLKLDGDERAYTVVYYHGFVSGRSNQLQLPVDAMAAATDRVVDHCIDKPGDKLLTVFELARKQPR